MKTIQELEAMEHDDLREMLAELAGWKLIRFKGCQLYYFNLPLEKVPFAKKGECLGAHSFGDLPDYPADLNACHAVEMALSEDQGNTYINTIADSIDPMGEMGWKLDLAICRATARQRTIALISCLQNPNV